MKKEPNIMAINICRSAILIECHRCESNEKRKVYSYDSEQSAFYDGWSLVYHPANDSIKVWKCPDCMDKIRKAICGR